MTRATGLASTARRRAGLPILAVLILGLPAAVACPDTPKSHVVNVKTDLAALGIHSQNAIGDGKADDTTSIQSAIDNAAANGGGTIIVPGGIYRVKAITIKDGVNFIGSGPKLTVFRATEETKYLITMKGGLICDLTVYGTPTEETSGDNWVVGAKGIGQGSSALAVHVISVRDAPNGAIISNVQAFEARYDCLYVRGSKGLRVRDCVFNRAGRNVVSMVGSDEDFVFSNCTIGSLWGLYHFDIEPGDGRYVRDGLFVNCTFDGGKAGAMGTDTWGSFLCLSGHSLLKSRDITIADCRFEKTYIRVRGVFPRVSFLGNKFDHKPAFVRIPKNKVGELRDVVVRGNSFAQDAAKSSDIIWGVSFTGKCEFAGNSPPMADEWFEAEGTR